MQREGLELNDKERQRTEETADTVYHGSFPAERIATHAQDRQPPGF